MQKSGDKKVSQPSDARLTYRSMFGDYGYVADHDRHVVMNKLGRYEDIGSPEEILSLLEESKSAKKDV